MLTVEKMFHVTHMVKDLDAAEKAYQYIFQTPYMRRAPYHEIEARDASFTFVADAMIEIFCPRDPSRPGGRFIQRFGEDLANFGWLVAEEMEEAARLCESKGYRLAGPLPAYFFIHPRDAYGMMVEIAKGPLRDDPRAQPDWSSHWGDNHPLGIERMNTVTFVVRDLEGALAFLQDLVGARLIHRDKSESDGRESGYLWIKDHIIELEQPLSWDSDLGKYLAEKGPKVHSVTFKVKSLQRAADSLRQRGVQVLGPDNLDNLTLAPADMLGAIYMFSERSVPNDPRDS